nr:PREDICTED: uncharacterized protein LOC109039952 [Bemisia tabaci]
MADEYFKLRIPIFDGSCKDYDGWKYRLELLLKLKECYEAVDPDINGIPDDIEEQDCARMEIKARNYLVNVVSNSVLDLIRHENNAKDMLTKLDNTFAITNTSMKLMIKRKLLETRFDPEDPTIFLKNLEKHIIDLKNSGENVCDEDHLNYLLLTLPESMSHLHDIVDALPVAQRKADFVKKKIMISFEKKSSDSSLQLSDNFEALNLQAHKPSRGNSSDDRSYNRGRSRGFSRRPWVRSNNSCHRCGGTGHYANVCPSYSNNRGVFLHEDIRATIVVQEIQATSIEGMEVTAAEDTMQEDQAEVSTKAMQLQRLVMITSTLQTMKIP